MYKYLESLVDTVENFGSKDSIFCKVMYVRVKLHRKLMHLSVNSSYAVKLYYRGVTDQLLKGNVLLQCGIR